MDLSRIERIKNKKPDFLIRKEEGFKSSANNRKNIAQLKIQNKEKESKQKFFAILNKMKNDDLFYQEMINTANERIELWKHNGIPSENIIKEWEFLLTLPVDDIINYFKNRPDNGIGCNFYLIKSSPFFYNGEL